MINQLRRVLRDVEYTGKGAISSMESLADFKAEEDKVRNEQSLLKTQIHKLGAKYDTLTSELTQLK